MFSRNGANALLFAGALWLGSLVVGGCGHKGTPQPPPQKIPQPIVDLKVTQRGNQMLVSFTYPQVTVSGLPIEDIVAVELWDYVLPVPDFRSDVLDEDGEGDGEEGAKGGEEEAVEEDEDSGSGEAEESPDGEEGPEEGGESEAAEEVESADDEAPPTRTEPLAGPQQAGPAGRTGVVDDIGELNKLGEIGTTIESAITEPVAAEVGDFEPATYGDAGAPSLSKESLLEVDWSQFAGAGKRHTSLAGDELNNAIHGDKVKMTLDLGKVEPGELNAVVYSVKSFQSLNRASAFSNLVTIIPRVTPDPPSQLEATATPNGIRLGWTFEGEEPEEFRIYRRDPLQPSFDLHLGAREGGESQFLDSGAAFGGEYVYVVTAVVNRVPLVESTLSQELEVSLVDEFAPEAPTDLVIFAEVGTARLLWEASDDDDVDGYFIFRREADGAFKRLNQTPHRRTDYNDTEAASGRRYAYRIVAVDLTGNTSEPSEEVETRIP